MVNLSSLQFHVGLHVFHFLSWAQKDWLASTSFVTIGIKWTRKTSKVETNITLFQKGCRLALKIFFSSSALERMAYFWPLDHFPNILVGEFCWTLYYRIITYSWLWNTALAVSTKIYQRVRLERVSYLIDFKVLGICFNHWSAYLLYSGIIRCHHCKMERCVS